MIKDEITVQGTKKPCLKQGKIEDEPKKTPVGLKQAFI